MADLTALLSALVLPGLLCAVGAYGLLRGVDVFDAVAILTYIVKGGWE